MPMWRLTTSPPSSKTRSTVADAKVVSEALGLDLDWFAADRDGHVAHFMSNGSGGVPPSVVEGDYGERAAAFYLYLRDTAPPPGAAVVYDLAAVRDPPPFGAPASAGTGRAKPIHAYPAKAADVQRWGCLVFLESLEEVRAEIAAGAAVSTLATEGYAVELPPGDAAWPLLRALHQRGACRTCTVSRPDETAPRHGLYAYDCESLSPPPYVRQALPRDPITLDGVPHEFRPLVERLRLRTIRFAECRYFGWEALDAVANA